MISKDRFIAVMEQIRQIDDEYTKIKSVLCDSGVMIEMPQYDSMYDTAIEALEAGMHDEEATISYYIFGLEFGQAEMAKNCITYDDGRVFSLRNVDELYDYLVMNANESEKSEKKYDW